MSLRHPGVHNRVSSSAWARAAAVTALGVLVLVAIFLDLGRPYFWDPGEGRYAETVREMLLSRDWIRPTLNFLPYYDKPPGFYWLVAASFAVFGTSEWAARLPSALAAVSTIGLTVAFAWRRLGPPTALGAGAILATAIQFVVLGRSVRMDMLLTLLMTGTLLHAFALWEEAAPAPRRPTWPIYVLPALGLLVKGPVAAVLPALVVAAFALSTGELERLRRFRPGPGLAVAAALGTSWYLAAAVRAPDYLWAFLWQHNLHRFVGGARAGHAEPIWFYVWVLPLTFLPWTLFLPGGVRWAFRRARRRHGLPLFLLLWVAVPFVFFTLSRAKLATYLLPVFPALALLVSAYVARVLRSPAGVHARAFRAPALLWSTVLAAAALGVPLGIAIRYPAYAWQATSALVLVVFAILLWATIRRARWQRVPALVLASALAAQVLFYRAATPIVNELSSWRAAAEVAHGLPPEARIFAYKTRGHSFTFYDGRVPASVRAPERVAEVLAQAEPVGLLTKTKFFERIRSHLAAPVCIWWQNGAGRVLLANRPRPSAGERSALVPPGPGPGPGPAVVTDSPQCAGPGA